MEVWEMVKAVRKLSVFVLLAALLFVFSVAAEAATTTVRITNSTGYDIYYLYISSSATSSWEEDVLGTQILPNGGSVHVQMPRYNQFDLKAIDIDGDPWEWYQFPGNTTRITLRGPYDRPVAEFGP